MQFFAKESRYATRSPEFGPEFLLYTYSLLRLLFTFRACMQVSGWNFLEVTDNCPAVCAIGRRCFWEIISVKSSVLASANTHTHQQARRFCMCVDSLFAWMGVLISGLFGPEVNRAVLGPGSNFVTKKTHQRGLNERFAQIPAVHEMRCSYRSIPFHNIGSNFKQRRTWLGSSITSIISSNTNKRKNARTTKYFEALKIRSRRTPGLMKVDDWLRYPHLLRGGPLQHSEEVRGSPWNRTRRTCGSAAVGSVRSSCCAHDSQP